MLLNLSVGILFVWIGLFSWLVYRTIVHYNKLTKGVEKKSLTHVLEELLKNQKETGIKIDQITKRCQQIEQDEIPHIQKIGLIRFNPFTDTGGNQSFVLALLDGKNDGVVISSLHSREATRWYSKKIKDGKGQEHELSEEEKKAVQQANLTHLRRQE